MKRAAILKAIVLPATFILLSFCASAQTVIYVSPYGDDNASGTENAPLGSLGAAIDAASRIDGDVVISLRGGQYIFDETEVITPERIGKGSLTITSCDGETAVLSGLKTLSLKWHKGRKGLMKASCDTSPDQLYIGGEKRILARYPDWTGEGLWGGVSADALSPERVKKWKDPAGGYIHSMHRHSWGSQHYIITGKDGDKVTYEGGWQVTRPYGLHNDQLFVENIREELDTPGEWFWDKNEKMLYYYPLEGEDVRSLTVQAAVIAEIIRIEGCQASPVRNITIKGLRFTGTERMFKEPYETLLRSDWGILRKGVLTLVGTENCSVEGCEFTDLGGNAIFISGYASGDRVTGNHIHGVGGSAVCLVGEVSAVRSGAFVYENFIPYEQMDKLPGPANGLFPRDCIVDDNLIYDLGQLEKQVAGVEIQVASHIEVRHNSIYDVPRAGINIGDGSFGGHIIEYNDVFDTVLESGDHGAFNSWGRDRFWHPDYARMTKLVAEHPELILLDAMSTTVIRCNRFRCDHGWDIDLDDGSSNYHIYSNLCLSGGIKLREGFNRTVENNLVINNTFHPHVWFPDSGDVVMRNVWMKPYAAISLNGWGKLVDYNFFASGAALDAARVGGTDANSVAGALDFLNAVQGDFTLPAGSEAFKVGFENIPMDSFGVTSPALKALAKTPAFPVPYVIDSEDITKTYEWLGATVRSVTGLGDRSAYGLPDETGVVLVKVSENSPVASSGLRDGDVIRAMNGESVEDVEDLFTQAQKKLSRGSAVIAYFRGQKESQAELRLKATVRDRK